MLVSIIHRATGVALTVAGLTVLVWWLVAIAEGPDGYRRFSEAASHPIGLFVLIGLTWAFFQHLLSGIRHLFMDAGSAFELQTNKRSALLTVAGAIVLTLAVWVPILGEML
jgi:succinate dehydrogenase / fumarate reductase cytochrome b subunit